MLSRNEGDIVVADMFTTLARSRSADFSTILEYAE